MNEKVNKTKLYVVVGFSAMVITSFVVGIIMAKNMNKDESIERHNLTSDYKLFKKKDYAYEPIRGESLYKNMCAKCHLSNGNGSLQTPPLSGSELVNGNFKKTLKVIVKGLSGKIIRNDKSYNSIMPSFDSVSHEDLAHISNYIRNSFGNSNTELINPVEVIKIKVDNLSRKNSFIETEL